MKSPSIKQYFSEDGLKVISHAIQVQEQFTSGEIRVSIRLKQRWFESKRRLKDLAIKEFYRLGMQKTKDRSGVLLYFLMEEHQFYILADEGIHAKVVEGLWESVANIITEHFKESQYVQGVCEAIKIVGKELQICYPRKQNDADELSNSVEIH